jgi:hypothetical protein
MILGCVDIATCGAAKIALRHTLNNSIPNRCRLHITQNSLIFILSLNMYINILQSDFGVLIDTLAHSPASLQIN